MSLTDLLEELRRRDIELRVDGGQLRCLAPAGALGPDLREQVQQSKNDIIEFLNMAQAVASQQPAIVPLQPHGTLPPIFAVAGHNGDVFCYRALAQHLGADQPFFGLQPTGLDGRSQPLTSVEALAAYFAAQIRSFQPDGPCVIAGYCAGGAVAFELAQQLQQQGTSIRLIALFGCHYPHWHHFLPQLRHRLALQTARIRKNWQILATLSLTEYRQYVAQKLEQRKAQQEAEERDAANPLRARRIGVEKATMAAVARYTPGYFAGRVCLLQPNAQWRYANDRQLGWPPTAAETMEEYCGPDDCDGYTMLQAPSAAVFAEFFRRL
jgi:thioesterase domain-containing protein